jgi:gamma-glutamylcyclotransferase (GGCT)/AIG2-like uncharacterized protein YtfP
MTETAVFVYGTLKRGLKYHRDYVPAGAEIREAWCWGRLYDLSAGYPALELPAGRIWGEGGSDPGADAERAARMAADILPSGSGQCDDPTGPSDAVRWAAEGFPAPSSRPAGDWDRVRGELVILSDPVRQLPHLDELEEFIPGGNGLYRRVLCPVYTDAVPKLSWIYEYLRPHRGRRISTGSWPN